MEKILIVHHAPLVRNSLRRQLPGRYDVLEAATPAEALDVCRDHGEIDLLVCDVELEMVSGMELAALLKGWYVRLRTVLIADRAYERWTKQQQKEFSDLPAETVVILQKSFDCRGLEAAIQELTSLGTQRHAGFRRALDASSGLQGAD